MAILPAAVLVGGVLAAILGLWVRELRRQVSELTTEVESLAGDLEASHEARAQTEAQWAADADKMRAALRAARQRTESLREVLNKCAIPAVQHDRLAALLAPDED